MIAPWGYINAGVKMGLHYASDMQDVVELVPVDEVFVTGMCRFEDAGGGMMRSYFYADEQFPTKAKVLKVRMVTPFACAMIMHAYGTDVLSKIAKRYPDAMRMLATVTH